MNNYYEKYIKYKNKYLQLKNNKGGFFSLLKKINNSGVISDTNKNINNNSGDISETDEYETKVKPFIIDTVISKETYDNLGMIIILFKFEISYINKVVTYKNTGLINYKGCINLDIHSIIKFVHLYRDNLKYDTNKTKLMKIMQDYLNNAK